MKSYLIGTLSQFEVRKFWRWILMAAPHSVIEMPLKCTFKTFRRQVLDRRVVRP